MWEQKILTAYLIWYGLICVQHKSKSRAWKDQLIRKKTWVQKWIVLLIVLFSMITWHFYMIQAFRFNPVNGEFRLIFELRQDIDDWVMWMCLDLHNHLLIVVLFNAQPVDENLAVLLSVNCKNLNLILNNNLWCYKS